MTSEKLPDLQETENMAKQYQSAHLRNSEKIYPDGLDEMIPHLLVDN